MRPRTLLSLGVLTLALAGGGCGDATRSAADPAAECSEELAPDARVNAEPPRFVETWRAGGADTPVELAMPLSVNPAPDGRLAIVDFRLGVAGMEPGGAWTGPLTRPGEGPGEIDTPLAAAYAEDGTLAILDFGNAKAVFLQPGGELLREERIDPIPLGRVFRKGELNGLGLAADGTGILIERELVPDEPRIVQTLLRLPPDGSAADTLATVPVPSLPGAYSHQVAPGWPRLVAAIGVDGRIAWAGHEPDYAIEVLAPDGTRTSICRTVEPAPLRGDEIEPPEGVPPEFGEAIAAAERPEDPAPISRLLFARDGRLWVERERFGYEDGGAAFTGRPGSLFDVFDPGGRYLGELRAPDGFHVMAAAGETVWGLEYGAYDVPSVVAYRLEPPG